MKDPREHPRYKEALEKTITETEKVLNSLKNGECIVMYSTHSRLVMKQGKGQTEKPTGINRLQIDYKIEKVN